IRRPSSEGDVGVQSLPGGNAAPRNLQSVIPIDGDHVRSAVAIEIAKQHLINFFSFRAEEFPLHFPGRRVIPTGAGRKEEIINTVAVKITYAQVRRGIGRQRTIAVDRQHWYLLEWLGDIGWRR